MRPYHLLPIMLALTACAGTTGDSMGRSGGKAPALMITSDVVDGTGNMLGTARLLQEADGTRVTLAMRGLPAGTYAVHLHQTGLCQGPAFTTAGGHFNPAMKQHGSLNPAGEHQGDLPNMVVGDDRRGSLDAVRPGLRLTDGSMPLLDADGAAIVVHAQPDDYRTDPAGNAGQRIACGVLAHGKPAA